MKAHTEYLYSFATASLTLRVIEHLRHQFQSKLNSVAVINLIDCWIVKINLKATISVESSKNLRAFLSEMGVAYEPSVQILTALKELEAGESPTKIMNRHKIVIVAHGKPEKEEIEIFRDSIVERLGYCPQNMA